MTNNKKRRYSKKMKLVAVMLMSIFACELLFPNVAMALTSGPSQPEVQGFEPVGTTDMVDMFSGSFVYNIPLMDVEGYPVNISYHGGINMEQEASWVGLGWSLNPGVINRAIRGVPDDFNGDSLYKDVNIKPETTLRVGLGAGLELAGKGDPAASHVVNGNVDLGVNLNISNYKGVSCDFSFGGGINVFHSVSAGVNVGVGSQTGATIDYNASASFSSSQIIGKDMAAGVGLNAGIGGGYSTRSGLKGLSYSVGVSAQSTYRGEDGKGRAGSGALIGLSVNVPIGLQNFVPVITNSSTMNSIYGRLKLGGEAFTAYAYGSISGMFSKLTYDHDASRNSYGYLYLQNASISNTDILDFTRDKDGMFNKSMQYLPVPNMTYDVYSVSGQGTGGIFRPFRNDFGSIYDPLTKSTSNSNSYQVEAGLGDLFEAGLDRTTSSTDITSGPWLSYMRSGTATKGFTKAATGGVYENVYFKQGGELTLVDENYFNAIGKETPIGPTQAMGFPNIKPNSDQSRDPRANIIYYHTAKEASLASIGTSTSIPSYKNDFTDYSDPVVEKISRVGVGNFQRKSDQISEIVQVQKDGRKYVYGIPALNNVQREATFSVDPASRGIDEANGTVRLDNGDASEHNSRGRDNYYNNTITPSYAHSYLLTAVLSNDYMDVTGDGISDDDLGTFTKFNYTRTDSDYRWVAPYSNDLTLAQYNPGFWSDKADDKANLVCGSREQWNLHVIETKNYIAEFYTSQREDALGISAALLNDGEPGAADLFTHDRPGSRPHSYKLDSIKLYNKHDRFVNRKDAIPIKTVFFVYDYSLCRFVPNSDAGGKLTLQKIYFRYGNSQKSMISPYQFTYGQDPDYDPAAKDRWGNYKPNDPTFPNCEYSYVNQNDPSNDDYAAAWSLTTILLPSGGSIYTIYESNDYAFVQDKPVNEMFMVKGLGNSSNFMPGAQLYADKNTPYLYAYFKRRTGSELPALSFAQNYLGKDFDLQGDNCLYFNFNVQLTGANNTYEQIKGYAHVLDVGICGNNSDYGYVRFRSVTPQGGGGTLSPITYTALNVGRYNLPHIIYPGQDPDETDLKNVLAGLKNSFNNLVNISKSPVLFLLGQGGGRSVNLSKSYIRLQSVGLAKKGGGQRVRGLYFLDQWDQMAGADEQFAVYGKEYIYKISDPYYGEITSGIASYEPLIGGDENPFRQPVKYTAQSGSNWPPFDAVDLYQEMPIGESLYPPGQIGYSKVTVTSVHKDDGRGSKNRDVYEFYTAKDFPAQFVATSINTNSTNHYDFFQQKNLLTATQGYTLIFNDMHGKQKKTEHDVYNAGTGLYQPISYQIHRYRQNGNKLDNTVKCFMFDGSAMAIRMQRLGVEEDLTMDSREKNEETKNSTLNANLNVFLVPVFFIPIPVPYKFSWHSNSQTRFQSAVVSKVVQQYGILDNIESYNEGAKTTMYNEVFDPLTGQPVVTSVNNEFRDREYTTNIPASWVYKGMAGAYTNIDYKDEGTISVDAHRIGTLNISNTTPLFAGDQLSVSYRDPSGHRQNITAWVMGKLPVYSPSGVASCDGINVLPRFPANTPGWDPSTTLNNVAIRVVSSGHKNMLHENVETFTSMDVPYAGTNTLNAVLTSLVDVKARTFADSNTRIFHNYISNPDSVNPYAIGERGEWRLLSEYVYHTNRNYANTTSRTAGLYKTKGIYAPIGGYSVPFCGTSPYNYLYPAIPDSNWHAMRTITKWTPWGKEVENVDAIGNYSTAVYGHNESLPVAVAANAKQGDILTLSFEDQHMLRPVSNIMDYGYFNYVTNGPGALWTPSLVYNMLLPTGNISNTVSHTGTHSYIAVNNGIYMPLPLRDANYGSVVDLYNNYYSNSVVSGFQFSTDNEYLPFGIVPGNEYIASFWVNGQDGSSGNITEYAGGGGAQVADASGAVNNFPAVKRSNIIDGWQLYETRFSVPASATSVRLGFVTHVGGLTYIDDIRVFPANANMKAFVYGAVDQNPNATKGKLLATFDENNFGTIYEYDQEGNLVRVKKETSKGMMTVSESRSGNPKGIY